MLATKKALITLHFSAFLMAATGLFSQTINLPAWDITGYRTWIASVALFVWVWWREGHVALQSRVDYGRMVLLGALLCLHWVTFFHSMQVSSIAVGMLSLFAYPVITVFLEPLIKGTAIDWRDVLSGLFVLTGIYFLVPEFSVSNSTTQGVFWGIVSAFSFALRNLLLGHWFSGQSSARSMSYQVLVVALLMTPVLVVSKHSPSALDGGLMLLLGLVCTAFSHTLFGYALRHLKAKTVGLVACMQPVYGVIYGIVLLHSIPELSTLMGGIIIVIAASYESIRVHYAARVTAKVP